MRDALALPLFLLVAILVSLKFRVEDRLRRR